MALDPSIALGVRPIEVQNPLNQYAQVAQLQNFQRQSDLANRAIEQEDLLNQAYAKSIDPTTGQIDANKLRKNMATSGIASKLPAAEQSIMQGRKTRTEVEKGELELGIAQADKSIRDISGYNTRADALRHIEQDLAAKKINPQQAQQFVSMLPPDDAGMPQFQLQMLRRALSAKDQLEQQFTTQDYAGGTRVIATPKYAGAGGAQVVQGSDIKKTATIADQIAERKFAWEKANPGFELKENEDGYVFGVNKLTGQSFPVMMGGAAPAAAPMGGNPRIPANNLAPTPANVNRLTPASSQVIPGMNSVLDQRAPTAPMATATPQMPQAGMPLKVARKEAPAKFNDTDMQLAGLAGSLKEFKDEVNKNLFTGAKFLPSGADTSRMQAKYTSLLMGVKDLYTLGALAGPDMSIIESQLTNPASWSGKLTTKKGFEEQIQVIEDMLKRSATNLENTYSRTPRATKEALKGLPGASDNDPLGLLNKPGR